MQNIDWAENFKKLYDHAVSAYHAGERNPAAYFSSQHTAFLAAIGGSPQEVFDFVEDWCQGGEPAFETVLLVTSVRRDYLQVEQSGRPSGKVVDSDQLPAKRAELGGIPWLPRIIQKAEAKLRGEMPPELMYGCGGDREFLRSVNIHPADFLRFVWSAEGDPQKVLAFVNRSRGQS